MYRKIESESILVPIKDNVGDMGSIYNLNDVGAYGWDNLDGEKRLTDIKEKLLEEFDVSPERAEEDLLEFIGQLREIGAIEAIE